MLRKGIGRIKHPPFDLVSANLERKVINEKQKMKAVDQLREKDHDYKAFFVCRYSKKCKTLAFNTHFKKSSTENPVSL